MYLCVVDSDGEVRPHRNMRARPEAFLAPPQAASTHSTPHADRWLNVRVGTDAALALGMANVIVVPDMFQQHRAILQTAGILLVEGPLQKSEDGVIHVRGRRVERLDLPDQSGPTGPTRQLLPRSHDFR